MANRTVAGTGALTVDLSSKTNPGIGKRLKSWHFCAKTAAADIELRDGTAAGQLVAEIQIPAAASASQAYPQGNELVFKDGLFVNVISGGTSVLTGSVDV